MRAVIQRVLSASVAVNKHNISEIKQGVLILLGVEIDDEQKDLDYMLNKITYLMENLLVYPENMLENLNKTGGLIFSQEVLLALVKRGATREDAYLMVQRNAMQAWRDKKDFK